MITLPVQGADVNLAAATAATAAAESIGGHGGGVMGSVLGLDLGGALAAAADAMVGGGVGGGASSVPTEHREYINSREPAASRGGGGLSIIPPGDDSADNGDQPVSRQRASESDATLEMLR